MNLFHVTVTAALTTLTIIVLAIVGVWSVWPKTAEAGVTIAAHAASFNRSAEHCTHFDTGHIAIGEAIVTAALDLDDRQTKALQPIATVLENWREQAVSLCSGVDFEDLNSSLTGLEGILRTTAATVGELKPAIIAFHASLTEEQHAKLKSYMAHHRHSRGDRGARHGHGFGQ